MLHLTRLKIASEVTILTSVRKIQFLNLHNTIKMRKNEAMTAGSCGGVWILLTYQTAVHLFAFLGLDLPQVELELLSLQDVAVCPAALAWSGGNASCRGTRKQNWSRSWVNSTQTWFE